VNVLVVVDVEGCTSVSEILVLVDRTIKEPVLVNSTFAVAVEVVEVCAELEIEDERVGSVIDDCNE